MPPDTAQPVLKTSRLMLHRLTLGDDDASFMLRLMNDADFIRHIGDRNIRSLDDARESLRTGPVACQQAHGHSLYRVSRNSDGVSIGTCGLVFRAALSGPDLGYAFLPEARGFGYAHEAAEAVLSHAKTAGVVELMAVVSVGNAASMRLLARLGFQMRGTVRLTPEAEALNLFRRSL